MKKTAITIAAATLAFAFSAQAQTAGSWLVKGGAMTIMPDTKSGDLSAPSQPGSKVDTSSSSTSVAGGIAYMFTDHWSVELPLATPFSFDIEGKGTVDGVGKIGETKVLPATVFGQYHFFAANATLRPYVGIGLTYAYFYNEKGNGTLSGMTNPGDVPTKMNIDSKFAPTPQIGLDWQITDRWFAEAMVAKTFLKTKTTLSTGQTIDITLDPWSFGAFIGYRF